MIISCFFLQNNQNINNNDNSALFISLFSVAITVIALIVSIKVYRIMKKPYEAIKKKHIIFSKISAMPWIENGSGGWKSSCYIYFKISNPTEIENEISAMVKTKKTGDILAEIKNKALPASQTKKFKIEFSHKKFNTEKIVNKYKDKKLILIIEDVRGNKVKKNFIFSNLTNLNQEIP